jgi:hypothetical protein
MASLKVHTDRMRFDNATRFFSFWKLIKQPVRANFERYVDQITQNVITLRNICKIETRIKVIGQWKSKNRVALSNRVRCVWIFIIICLFSMFEFFFRCEVTFKTGLNGLKTLSKYARDFIIQSYSRIFFFFKYCVGYISVAIIINSFV